MRRVLVEADLHIACGVALIDRDGVRIGPGVRHGTGTEQAQGEHGGKGDTESGDKGAFTVHGSPKAARCDEGAREQMGAIALCGTRRESHEACDLGGAAVFLGSFRHEYIEPTVFENPHFGGGESPKGIRRL